ncbi:MAG: phosphoribosylglycinamide formyltransferase [Flavobacteriaceae bacterium]|nr:MAG: phosphoribosylglycinamide formyltransferase [Flavobacteriaceae bacterium]
MKIAVFVSGSGTNLQNILDLIQNKTLDGISVSCIVADRVCLGMERGLEFDIPTFLIERDKDLCLNIDQILDPNIDYIVLAGFLSILTEDFCRKWEGKIINIHPSLLPKYGGKGMWGHHVHQAVLDNQETISGATVHFVTSQIDQGEVIVQKSFAIESGYTIKDLQAKVQKVEFEIYPQALKILLDKRAK